jgi:predicted nucleic acid-binding protein
MSDRYFFDTNVLLYAFATGDRREIAARALLAEGGWISVQVLNEFANVSYKKLHWNWEDIEAAIGEIRTLFAPPLPLTLATHHAGARLSRRYRINFYDALIVASAIEAGCSVVLTEDMADGMTVGGVTIRNPFREA